MSYFGEAGEKKVNEKRLQEMYDWYREIRRAMNFWSGLLDWLFLMIITCLVAAIVLGIPYYFYTQFWNKASIDAKFSGLISLLVLVLGIIIGRATKKNKNK